MSGTSTPNGTTFDRETFAQLYAEAYPRLLLVGYAMLGNRAAAEDAVQQAAATALTKMQNFTPGTNFTAWLAQFVRHNALNDRRREKTRKASAIENHPVAAPESATDRSNGAIDSVGRLSEDQGHFSDDLRSGLLTLSPVARACLLLRTVAELDYREIAQTLDVPKGTAMSHVYRARQHLRQHLSASQVPEGSL